MGLARNLGGGELGQWAGWQFWGEGDEDWIPVFTGMTVIRRSPFARTRVGWASPRRPPAIGPCFRRGDERGGRVGRRA